MSIKM